MKREPVQVASWVLAALQAALLWGLSMGWLDLTQDQLQATLQFAGVVVPGLTVGVGYLVRRFTTPTEAAEATLASFRQRIAELEAKDRTRP